MLDIWKEGDIYLWQILLLLAIGTLILWKIAAYFINKLYGIKKVTCGTCGKTVKTNVYPYPYCAKCKGKIYPDDEELYRINR